MFFLFTGRVLHTVRQMSQARDFLTEGMSIAQSLNKSEEEAKIRYRLGKYFFFCSTLQSNCSILNSSFIGLVWIDSGDNEKARMELETSAQILEAVRLEQRSPEAKQTFYVLQTKCYHTLQKVLVSMGRHEEALVAAERCKSRTTLETNTSRKTLVTCSESIFDIVNKSKTNILYFSLADDELYIWFLQPQKRIVRFNVVKINESNFPMQGQENFETSSTKVSLLENYVLKIRASLGMNAANSSRDIENWRSTDNLIDDFANERAGFLRMVNRNHLLNSSNYSLSSLFSLGSVGGSVASLQGSTR